MSKSRKDTKGRVLPPNVSQKSDGRYIWRKMIDGKQYSICENDLIELKKKIIQKEADIQNNVCRDLGKCTVNQYFDKYIELVEDIKPQTKQNYRNYWKWYIRESRIGKMQLGKVRNSDIVELYKELGDKLAYSTIKYVDSILKNMFECAMYDDRLIPDNPCKRAMSKIKKTESEEREALTEEQQSLFIDYTSKDRAYSVYLPLFTVMLGTGCRIGEVLGLRWCDIDMENGIISINHTLSYKSVGNGKHDYFISTTKSKSGNREIPMLPEVRKALINQKKYKSLIGISNDFEVDGYSDFVFTSKKGKPYTQEQVNRVIRGIIDKINLGEKKLADKEGREYVEFPRISAHVLRHTFCTRFCENETNVKIIQAIMGHSKIETTMNIYSHATAEKKKDSMNNLIGKIKIS